MKKLIKWVVGLVIALALLMVLAVFLLPVFFDPNEHKPQIQQMAADSIGREVVLNGPIEWSVFPWLAINLNDVSVSNAPGFKGDYIAEVEQVAVRVKLLPLLRQQIQIGQVELQQPNINLQVARSGSNNWQSIMDQLADGEDSTADSNAAINLEIEGININSGVLSYTDSAADLELQLTALNFTSAAIKSDVPTPMSVKAKLSLAAQQLDGQLQAAWQAEDVVNGGGMKMTFSQLKFKGHSAAVPLSFDTSGQVELDLAQDTLTVESLQLAYGVMQINTPVNGKQLSGNMALSGALKIAEFSLAELFAQMGSPLVNQADNDLSGNMKWSLIGDRLQLQSIAMQLDDSGISGDVDIKKLSQLNGQFNLNVDSLNLDHYLPSAEAASTSSDSSSSTALDLGKMNGQINMQKLVAAGVTLTDITLNIRTDGKNLTVEPLKAGFYQGLLNTRLKLQPDNRTEKLHITHQMQDFQAGGLLTDLIGSEYLTGLGQLNADIKVDQPFSARPLQSANGSVSYTLTDGDIVGIDVFQILQQSLSLLNKTDAQQANSELKTAFGLMEIKADINNGVLKTNKLVLNSPYFDLNGAVEIDLDQQTIKGTIKPMLTNIPQGVLNKNFEKLIDVRIPVKLSGQLLEPNISIDLAALVLATQQAKIDEKKAELKEDLFDAILGSKKESTQAKDNTAAEGEAAEGDAAEPELTDREKKRAEKDQLKRDLLEGLFKSKKKPKEAQEEQAEPTDEGDGGGN